METVSHYNLNRKISSSMISYVKPSSFFILPQLNRSSHKNQRREKKERNDGRKKEISEGKKGVNEKGTKKEREKK